MVSVGRGVVVYLRQEGRASVLATRFVPTHCKKAAKTPSRRTRNLAFPRFAQLRHCRADPQRPRRVVGGALPTTPTSCVSLPRRVSKSASECRTGYRSTSGIAIIWRSKSQARTSKLRQEKKAMTQATVDGVRSALKAVKEKALGRDIVSLGMVKNRGRKKTSRMCRSTCRRRSIATAASLKKCAEGGLHSAGHQRRALPSGRQCSIGKSWASYAASIGKERHRSCGGQRRRRQINGGDQPGGFFATARGAGRAARCRCLWSVAANHAR